MQCERDDLCLYQDQQCRDINGTQINCSIETCLARNCIQSNFDVCTPDLSGLITSATICSNLTLTFNKHQICEGANPNTRINCTLELCRQKLCLKTPPKAICNEDFDGIISGDTLCQDPQFIPLVRVPIIRKCFALNKQVDCTPALCALACRANSICSPQFNRVLPP